jgi:uncharacterized protein YndB with AHSA1/START domain
MTTEELRVSSLVPASPNRIFAAWMDERQHSAFTGARAHIDPWSGGRVSAWDGYIFGNHLFLDTGRRIVMAWRTTDFPQNAPDSQVDVTLEPVAGGTKVTIAHTGIPEGQSEQYREGWRTHYLDPMRRYFAKPEAMKAAIRAAVKGGILSQAGLTATRPSASRGAHNVFASDAPPPFTGVAPPPPKNAKARLAKLRQARAERDAAAAKAQTKVAPSAAATEKRSEPAAPTATKKRPRAPTKAASAASTTAGVTKAPIPRTKTPKPAKKGGTAPAKAAKPAKAAVKKPAQKSAKAPAKAAKPAKAAAKAPAKKPKPAQKSAKAPVKAAKPAKKAAKTPAKKAKAAKKAAKTPAKKAKAAKKPAKASVKAAAKAAKPAEKPAKAAKPSPKAAKKPIKAAKKAKKRR